MAATLAPIYVNDERVALQGNPKPAVSAIVTAWGKRPQPVEVVRLRSRTDSQGQRLRSAEVIDRTATAEPVYLRCTEPGGLPQGNPSPPSGPTSPRAVGEMDEPQRGLFESQKTD